LAELSQREEAGTRIEAVLMEESQRGQPKSQHPLIPTTDAGQAPRQAASSLCLTPNLPQALREKPGLSIWEKEKASI
jgi:hypothetical protein